MKTRNEIKADLEDRMRMYYNQLEKLLSHKMTEEDNEYADRLTEGYECIAGFYANMGFDLDAFEGRLQS